MGILTLISSQRHPKMDSEGDSEFEEKNGWSSVLKESGIETVGRLGTRIQFDRETSSPRAP